MNSSMVAKFFARKLHTDAFQPVRNVSDAVWIDSLASKQQFSIVFIAFIAWDWEYIEWKKFYPFKLIFDHQNDILKKSFMP